MLAAACFAGLALTGLLAYLSPVARWTDSASLQGFTELNEPQRTHAFDQIAHLADPVPYGVLGLALAGLALARGRRHVALAIPAVLVLAGLSAETLKPLLAQPRFQEWLGDGQIQAASWPSGHATAAMALALTGILAVPARIRPTAAVVGGGFAMAVAYAILALGWHFPSDVLGGFLLAALWTLLAIEAINRAEARWPTAARSRERPASAGDLLPAATIVAGALAMAAAVALARPRAILDFAERYTAFVAGAIAIAVLALALATLLAAGTRRAAGR